MKTMLRELMDISIGIFATSFALVQFHLSPVSPIKTVGAVFVATLFCVFIARVVITMVKREGK